MSGLLQPPAANNVTKQTFPFDPILQKNNNLVQLKVFIMTHIKINKFPISTERQLDCIMMPCNKNTYHPSEPITQSAINILEFFGNNKVIWCIIYTVTNVLHEFFFVLLPLSIVYDLDGNSGYKVVWENKVMKQESIIFTMMCFRRYFFVLQL